MNTTTHRQTEAHRPTSHGTEAAAAAAAGRDGASYPIDGLGVGRVGRRGGGRAPAGNSCISSISGESGSDDGRPWVALEQQRQQQQQQGVYGIRAFDSRRILGCLIR